MKKTLTAFAAALLAGGTAFAQLGDILNRADKIKKGVGAVRTVTHEFTEEEEIRIGHVVAARVLATYSLSSNDRLQTYVTLVGNTVAAYSTRPNLNWHFSVLDTPDVNAFSAPGGFIFVTQGALDQIDSEAELAAVLGHEIAHATEKHILREVKRANVISEGMSFAQDQYGRGGLTDAMAKKIGDVAIDKLFKTGIGRKEELEADRIGVQLAAAAGYAPTAYRDFLTALNEVSVANPSVFQRLGATHPQPTVRLKSLKTPGSEGQLLAERWETWTRRK